MPYETTCPKGHRLQVSDSHLGQRIQCPACNESFVVSDGGRMPPPPARAGRGFLARAPARSASDSGPAARWTGRPLVAIGLILALLPKGCESINQHSRRPDASAAAQAAVEQFDEDQPVQRTGPPAKRN